MAYFTALKTAINNAIKTNGNEEITGAVLQVILDAMVETLGESAINNLENALAAEVTNRENAVGSVASDLIAEAEARAALDYQVNNRINQEEYNRQNADAALSQTMSQGFSTLGSQMNALSQAISALNAAYQNGFLYGGVVTPSSSPANDKCFYIALQGGTYTNFGGVGVVQGINILKNDNGWKVEHIYDQTTLLNEFNLLRKQVIQAITSFTPIVIEGDVTNAPDEEDLTSNAQHLLQFKNNAYSPLEFSGLGRKYLRKNIAPLRESAAFNGFVEGVTAEETLSGTPEYIFWDRMNTRFVGIKDGVYYADWSNSGNYIPASTSLVYMYRGTPYRWDGSDFSVDETEVPNLVNCLTQDMINEANTIYIIRYDYTLKEDITIPANCVLEFDGGSISGNGTGKDTITGNNTQLFCIDNCLCVKLSGTFKNPIYVEWFGIKSGADHTLSNDSIFAEYIIPSMENIGQGVLAMRKTTEVYFSEPIVFNGTYDLDLKGVFFYSGQLVSTAISIGTDNSRIATGHTYFIEAVYNTDRFAFYNEGNIVENIGVALKNIKQCNITVNNVMYFAYCLRLYGNVGGCASNKINSTVIGGHCYYGVHCFGQSEGWVNENSFWCKSIISYSTNPADMCAICLDSENSNTCNGNFFLNPCVEGASTVLKLKNALYNVLYGVRGESIDNSFVCDDKSNSNTIFYTYITTDSVLGEYIGNNKAILISKTESNLPLVWEDNFNFATIANNNFKISLSTEDDGGVTKAKFMANESYSKGIFGRFVKLSTTDKDANIVIKTNLPGGRVYIAAVKKDFSSFLDIVTPEEAEERGLTQFINANLIKSSIVGPIDTLGDIRIFRTGRNSNYVYIQLDKNILSYGSGTDKAFLFIGVKTTALSSDIHTINVFSDNLCVPSYYYADCDISQIVCKSYFNFTTFSLASFLSFDIIHNNLGMSAGNKTIDLSNKTLYNNPNVLAFRGGGTLNVAGTKIYPNFNTIMDGKSAGLTVNGMPAAGTLYWQNGKPTWSDGTQWVDATGATV